MRYFSYANLYIINFKLIQNLNKIENVKESKFKAANKRENGAKNRFQTILPCKCCKIMPLMSSELLVFVNSLLTVA